MGFIINLFLDIIRKRKSYTTLSCGIFAWVGEGPEGFSPLMFNVLGVYNDNRGGDSCGVYFNRGSIHGIGAQAKYEALVKAEKLHTTVRPGKWPIVIGHCRKSSSGAITLENAQPVEVRSEAMKKLLYVQAHNGTITNHKELAEKYKVECKANESDSVVMSRIIQKQGFDVLAEYEGSAALVMHFTKEPNSLYAFHGESKSFNTVTEERPLHYVQIKGSGTYISSEAAPLEFIANGEKATSFKFNVLYKLTGNQIEEVRTIERTNAILKKSTYTNTSNTSRNDYAYGNLKDEVWDPIARRWVPKITTNASQLTFPQKSITYSTKGVTANIITSEVSVETYTMTDIKKIHYSKGYYHCGSDLAHGRYIVDSWGWLKGETEQTSLIKHILYFFYGNLLTGEDSYDDMRFYANENNIQSAADFYLQANFSKMSEYIYYNTVFPFTRRHHQPGSGYMEESVYFPNEKGTPSTSYYTGSFQPLFASVELEFDNGDFISFQKKDKILTIDMFKKDNDYFHIPTFAETLDAEKDRHNKEVELLRKDIKSDKKKIDDDLAYIMDCNDCTEHGLHDNGNQCFTCNMEFGKFTVADYKKKEQEQTALAELIAHNVPPILDDLESVIGDIQESSYMDTVKNEYNILVEAQSKLKELNL